jgi:hypothetical protein
MPVIDPVTKAGYELDFEDTFDGTTLDETRWTRNYLAHWSSREASAARYRMGDGYLRLLIEAGQPPWCPEFDRGTVTSTLQTGAFSGALGTNVGQLHFTDGLVVRQEQPTSRLYTPQYGLFELRCNAVDDPRCMVALWMIGFEDRPERSGEICVCEIFGRNVTPDRAGVGMGVHPWADPDLRDDFTVEQIHMDARGFHVYAVEWTPDHVAFFVDNRLVKVCDQAPAYPMQFMLGIYEFAGDGPARPYPREFVVDYFRGYKKAELI